MTTGIMVHGGRRHLKWLWKNIYDSAWSYAGRWHVEEVRPDTWLVADCGVWLPGEYQSVQGAMQAAEIRMVAK